MYCHVLDFSKYQQVTLNKCLLNQDIKKLKYHISSLFLTATTLYINNNKR